jgi:hypothetical protein
MAFAPNETSPGSFVTWQIALSPGEYIFEDFGNALTIVAQQLTNTLITLKVSALCELFRRQR